MNKVFALAPNENWIVDRIVKEWNEYNADITTKNINEAGTIWLVADWCWRHVPVLALESLNVVTTVHHIVPEKFDLQDFLARDAYTDAYHVPNQYTKAFIERYVATPIHVIPYWANQHVFKKSDKTKQLLRKEFNLPQDAFIMGSMQRDTEGSSIASGIFQPKLEKGPDIFCDLVNLYKEFKSDLHVVLTGWRRQYVTSRLNDMQVKHSYFELTSQDEMNKLYQCLDIYPVTSRIEGGPQSLIECGLLDVPVISTPMGMSTELLPQTAISHEFSANSMLTLKPTIPDVKDITLPYGFDAYRRLFDSL